MKQRVVVVDGIANDRNALETALRAMEDVEVFAFAGAGAALEAAARIGPDAIVCAYDPDAGAGRALVGALHGDARMREVPIVIVAPEGDRAACREALACGANDFVLRPVDPHELTRRVGNMLLLRDSRRRPAPAFADGSRREREHAARLEVLWRLGSARLDDEAFLQAVLAEGGSLLRGEMAFFGNIVRLDGAEMVVEVTHVADPSYPTLKVGQRYPVGETLTGEILREGRTSSWEDIRLEAWFGEKRRTQEMPWRAFIGTPFRVGATPYFMLFMSPQPLEHPFDALDHAFVETLASFCATRLHQRAQLERLRFHAEHDNLTGILNRATFRARGFAALRAGVPAAIAVVDIDRFREINDTLGHQIGDALLVEVASALSARADGDVVARLGADSFGIVIREPGDRAALQRRLDRYLDAFREPFGTGDRDGTQRVHVTASIGVALAPGDGTTFEQLLARADSACYAAKRGGRARLAFFDATVEDAFASARQVQNELAQALVRNEFVLHFQPHVELATRRVTGCESLVRWNHPRRGLLPPSEFLGVAEQQGMLAEIGGWVMRDTVRAATAWRRIYPDLRVWFNLSAIELADPALIRRLKEHVDLDGIGVEITETVAMRDVHRTMQTLAVLRELGLCIALDDFGTGYSSLAHLKRLPIDLVKIDRAFCAGVPGDPHDEAIVDAIVQIGRSFDFQVVAEGVESSVQAAALARAGCTYGQGFYFARPMAEDDFTVWLRRNQEVVLGSIEV